MTRLSTEDIRPEPDAGPDRRLRIGFMPLVDCAPLVVARDRGFARAEGLDLDLVRETSWANIRDRLVLGHFDAAHMLAPMAIAARLGLGHPRAPVLAPFVLDRGGNSIALSLGLVTEAGLAGVALDDPLTSGRAVAAVVAARREAGGPPLTLAMVHPFSCHNYQLRYWLAAAGIDPDRDVQLVVVPPPYMVDALAEGIVDGCCVGAPWPSLAVEAGVGRIVTTAAAVWPAGPEKVLGVRERLALERRDALSALLRALHRAGAWIADPTNHGDLAALLARPEIVGVEAEIVRRALDGRLVAARGEAPRVVPDFLAFDGDGATGPLHRPRVADGLWLAAQMLRWGQTGDRAAAFAAATAAFAPDLHDAALGPVAAPVPTTIEPFDGRRFDAADPGGWLDAVATPP